MGYTESVRGASQFMGEHSNGITELPLTHRFGVFFFIAGVLPNPLDIRFQRVSGLSAKVATTNINEGGQNLFTHRMPTRVGYENLVLERGFVVGSLLNLEFNATISLFKFIPSNVLVTLFSEDAVPISAWMFLKAFPVRWSTADLNAADGKVLIDTFELAYEKMLAVRI